MYWYIRAHSSTHRLSVQPLDDVARYVMVLIGNAYETLSVQPLDDVACYVMVLIGSAYETHAYMAEEVCVELTHDPAVAFHIVCTQMSYLTSYRLARK
jgi:hypothetical protein